MWGKTNKRTVKGEFRKKVDLYFDVILFEKHIFGEGDGKVVQFISQKGQRKEKYLISQVR